MALHRSLSLLQASALNMIDMIGIGPFIVTATVMSIMGGPASILAWVAGAVLAFLDASVWSELGAAMPEAGGSYVFLRESYGAHRWGRVMSFLFIWQTVFQASFVVASATIGFSEAVKTLLPLDPDTLRLVRGVVVILIVAALYRKVETVATITLVLWVCSVGTLLFVIVSGLTHQSIDLQQASIGGAFTWNAEGFSKLGDSMQSTVYSFLGYYNVCHLGSEIRNPERSIPRSMFLSVAVIAVLYTLMQYSISSVIPMSEIQPKMFVIGLFVQKIYGSTAATVVTVLVLIVALSSIFAVILGYSRIPYAAAKDGNFFKIFGRLHPRLDFPHISLLFIGGISLVLSVSFDSLSIVVAMVLTMRILVQFVGQSIGLVLYRQRVGAAAMPFRMWLFPLPLIASLSIWLWLFSTRDLRAVEGAMVMMAIGLGAYAILAKRNHWFPFQPAEEWQSDQSHH